MTNQEIFEGNKLIAEFMEFPYNDSEQFIISYYYLEDRPGTIDDLEYNSSWEWLMPVVEKCEKIPVCNKGGFAFIINGTLCAWDCYTFIEKTKLEAVYKAVIAYIKWYNEKTKKNNNNI
ncbi:MAG: hypothetical protein HGB12_14890 [Bacteroidetes bacterium]|nr:hypothetical protein [Bacteroidota bacterium]